MIAINRDKNNENCKELGLKRKANGQLGIDNTKRQKTKSNKKKNCTLSDEIDKLDDSIDKTIKECEGILLKFTDTNKEVIYCPIIYMEQNAKSNQVFFKFYYLSNLEAFKGKEMKSGVQWVEYETKTLYSLCRMGIKAKFCRSIYKILTYPVYMLNERSVCKVANKRKNYSLKYTILIKTFLLILYRYKISINDMPFIVDKLFFFSTTDQRIK